MNDLQPKVAVGKLYAAGNSHACFCNERTTRTAWKVSAMKM